MTYLIQKWDYSDYIEPIVDKTWGWGWGTNYNDYHRLLDIENCALDGGWSLNLDFD